MSCCNGIRRVKNTGGNQVNINKSKEVSDRVCSKCGGSVRRIGAEYTSGIKRYIYKCNRCDNVTNSY